MNVVTGEVKSGESNCAVRQLTSESSSSCLADSLEHGDSTADSHRSPPTLSPRSSMKKCGPKLIRTSYGGCDQRGRHRSRTGPQKMVEAVHAQRNIDRYAGDCPRRIFARLEACPRVPTSIGEGQGSDCEPAENARASTYQDCAVPTRYQQRGVDDYEETRGDPGSVNAIASIPRYKPSRINKFFTDVKDYRSQRCPRKPVQHSFGVYIRSPLRATNSFSAESQTTSG